MILPELSRNQIVKLWHISEEKASQALKDVKPTKVSDTGRVKRYKYQDVCAVLGRPEDRKARKRKPAQHALPLKLPSPAASGQLALNGNINAHVIFLGGDDKARAERLSKAVGVPSTKEVVAVALKMLEEALASQGEASE